MPDSETVVALPTFFDDDLALDVVTTRRFYADLAPRAGSVFVAGTNGEFLALSVKERRAVVELALEQFGPDRAIVHVGHVTTHQMRVMVRTLSDLPIRRFAVTPPMVFPAGADRVADHFAAARDATAGAKLYAYLYPEVCINTVEPESVPRLIEHGIDGFKLSGRAAGTLAAYLAAAGDAPIWTGDDSASVVAAAMGARGVVSGCANVDPSAWMLLSSAIAAADATTVRDAERRTERIVGELGKSVAHIKYALSELGYGTGAHRIRLPALSRRDRVAISQLCTEIAAVGRHDSALAADRMG